MRATIFAAIVTALATTIPVASVQAADAVELGDTGVSLSLPAERWPSHTVWQEDPGVYQYAWKDNRSEANVVFTVTPIKHNDFVQNNNYESLGEVMRDAGIPNMLDWYSEGHNPRVRKRQEEEIRIAGRAGTERRLTLIINDNWRQAAFFWFQASDDVWVWAFVYNTGRKADISDELQTIKQGIHLDPERY